MTSKQTGDYVWITESTTYRVKAENFDKAYQLANEGESEKVWVETSLDAFNYRSKSIFVKATQLNGIKIDPSDLSKVVNDFSNLIVSNLLQNNINPDEVVKVFEWTHDEEEVDHEEV